MWPLMLNFLTFYIPNVKFDIILNDYCLPCHDIYCYGLIASDQNPPERSLSFENANYGEIVGPVDVKCATEVGVTRARANDL